jgi:hypothetical protein
MMGHQSLGVCWQKLQLGWRSARTNQATFLLADWCNLVTLTIASLTRDADPLRPLPHALLGIIRGVVIVGFVD